MLNLLRKKRVIVDAMPNSLLREINSLRSRCHALRLANIKYHDMVVALCILLPYLSMISGGYRNLPFILIILIQYFYLISFTISS
jgi:hypothetical protein